jgi:transposase
MRRILDRNFQPKEAAVFEEYRSLVVVDHHKKVLVYEVVDLETGEVTSGKIGGDRLLVRRWLEGLTEPGLLYVEACRSWEWLSDLCDELGIECRLVDPCKMPEITKSTRKTDRHDVDAMLKRLLSVGSLPESYRPSRPERELRELTRNRMDLQKQRRETLNRLHALCDSQGLPTHRRQFADAEWRSHMIEEIGPQFGLVLELWLDHLAHVEGAVERVNQRIVALTQDRKDVQAIQAIPGVGPILGATVVAELGTVDRFQDSRHLASFTGLVPRVRSSAGKAQLGRITKSGPPALRWALTQAIITGLRTQGNPFARFYRKKRRRGERAMRAVCAAAHKLARVIFVVLSQQVAYDPLKVGRAA